MLKKLGLAVLLTGCATAPVEPLQKQKASTTLHLSGASTQERQVLEFFQEKGITDKAALATLLGNIKQESKFHTNICEGGARVPYERCHSGGFGLIQWTTPGRYAGLGRYARTHRCNPSELSCQLGYLVTEPEWKKSEAGFRRDGKGIGGYMNDARRWLGWGVEGKRNAYAWQYYNRLH